MNENTPISTLMKKIAEKQSFQIISALLLACLLFTRRTLSSYSRRHEQVQLRKKVVSHRKRARQQHCAIAWPRVVARVSATGLLGHSLNGGKL